jgi:hypothetical protein
MAMMVTPDERTHEERDHRQSARQPPEEQVGHAHQALRRLALSQQVTGEGEEWDRHEHRDFRYPEDLHGHRHEIDVGAREAHQRARRNDREERRPEHRQQQQGEAEEDHSSSSVDRIFPRWATAKRR